MSSLDSSLRPTSWADYIGQEAIKDNLNILLRAAKERQHPPEHLLFYGPPGLGKTTLAHLIAQELGTPMKITSGPAIQKAGDLAALLSNLDPGSILFIDEIHRLNTSIEEILYPAMESGKLDIITGKGLGASTLRLDLVPFTLIGATTRAALLSSPLRSRFSGGTFRLEFYTEAEIAQIITRSAAILEVAIEKEAARTIAARSRFTPRIANHFLRRCRDVAQLHKTNITQKEVRETLALLGIDDRGLSAADRKILTTIIEKFNGGPVGINTIATATAEEEATIEEVHEPYLIQIGFMERTPRGRVVTKKAYEHLGHKYPQAKQESLL